MGRLPAGDGLGVAATCGAEVGFAAVRAELGLASDYPADALAELERPVAGLPGARRDATDLPLVTLDPPGSRDLDQAVVLQRRRTGYRVHYAIADVAAFVTPRGALDSEARRRGQTLYLPDGKVPLHPDGLAEDAASLLPGAVRPAVLWTFDLDADALPVRVSVCRAIVRSTARLDYRGVQGELGLGVAHPSIELLPEVGRLRRKQAAERGAIELGLPEQQVEPDGAGGWQLALRPRPAVEEWNAEISLLTGMCAAEMMLSAGIGVLRTVPDPDPELVAGLRRSAVRLGVPWASDVSAGSALAALPPDRPEALAVHVAAARLLRGAGYTAFDGAAPAQSGHAGIGAAYAHVTAPLRRLVDRFAAEVCLATAEGREVPRWVRDALAELPSAMGNSDRVASRVERACIDQVQAWSMAHRVGAEFPATVLRSANGSVGEVYITDPPVIAPCSGVPEEGSQVRVRLVEADPESRAVAFEVS